MTPEAEHNADARLAFEPLVSPADPAEARTIAEFMRHRIEDDMMLALDPLATRGQLIRDRFSRLADKFCGPD